MKMETYIDKILRWGEGRRIEFKTAMPEGNQISQTVIAFANGAGGELFIGIDDKTKVVKGVADENVFKIEEQISQIVYDNCYPMIIPDIAIYPYNDRNIICVKVYPSKNGPYYLKSKGKNNGSYIRVGSTNRIADEAILSELERRNRNVSFDSLPLYDFSPDDCDLSEFVKFYFAKSGKVIEKEQLKTLDLIKIERNEEHATNAALLLASNTIRKQIFPYAKIECARFKGNTTSVMIDQQTIDCPVFVQPEEAMKFIMRNISQGSTIDLVYRNDRWEYPLKAIREVVVNAVIHRDYSILGSDIKIAIFDDMLEITSPGTLMPSVSPESLKNTPSEVRNRVIAPIFKDCKLIEQWGSGFHKIYAELAEYPDILFKINEPSLSFQVQFIKKDYLPEKGGLNQYNGRLNQKIEGLNAKKGGLNIDNGGLNEEIGGLNQYNGRLSQINEGLNSENGRLNQENEELNLQNGRLNPGNKGINVQDGRLNSTNGGLNNENGRLNEGIKSLLKAITEQPGIQIKDLADFLKRSIFTLNKQIKVLIKMRLVERCGSKKTGGYWVVDSKEKSDEE
jgi:ATP-dependent DNA helicase RecG